MGYASQGNTVNDMTFSRISSKTACCRIKISFFMWLISVSDICGQMQLDWDAAHAFKLNNLSNADEWNGLKGLTLL